jgi:hypothetical protein
MYKKLSEQEKKVVKTDLRNFVIDTRYKFLRQVKNTFWIIFVLTVIVSWYQSNWWLLLFVIPFNFFYSAYQSTRWLKYVRENSGSDDKTIMEIWNTHKKYTGQ